MAGEAIIGALRVVIGADSASLDKGLEKARSSMDGFGGQVGKLGGIVGEQMKKIESAFGIDTSKFTGALTHANDNMAKFSLSAEGLGTVAGLAFTGLAAAAVAATTAIVIGLSHAIDRADQLNEASQKFGIPIEELSALSLAGELSSVSMEELGVSLGKLSKNMAETAGGATGGAAKAFDALGISVTDSSGKLKTSTQVMGEIADKFSTMEKGAGKTTLAMEIFGKSGASMIPILDGGTQELAKITEHAQKLGQVFDKETGMAADRFNDSMTELGKVWSGFINFLLPKIIGNLADMSESFVQLIVDSDGVKKSAEGVASVFIEIGRATILLVGSLTALGQVIDGLNKQSESFGGTLNKLITNTEFYRTVSELATSTLETMRDKFKEGWDSQKVVDAGTAVKMTKDQVNLLNSSLNSFTGIMTATMGATATWTSNISAFSFGLSQATATMTSAIDAARRFGSPDENAFLNTSIMQSIANAINFKIDAPMLQMKDSTEKAKTAVDEWGRSLDANAVKKRAMDLIVGASDPWQKFSTEIKKADADLILNGNTIEQIGKVHQKIAENMNNTWSTVAPAIAGSFVQIGKSFEKEGKGMATFAKIAGIAQATVSMLVAAAKALEVAPFPANLAASAGALAAGAALVAQIKAVGGFARGGSFRVTGAGGTDSQRVMMDVSPGEQVDVWRPGEAGADPRGGQRDVTIHGLTGPKQLFTQGHVREFIDMFNEAIGDGARLRFA